MKRSLALLCVFVLAVGILAGCATPTTTATTPAVTTAAGTGATTTKAPGTTTTAGPVASKKVYFYAWTVADNMIPLTTQFNKDFAGKYELTYMKMADAATLTINTALASGEQIDVMTQSGAFDLATRAVDNIFLPLNEFFTTWGTTYKEQLGAPTEATMNINGKYYAIPYCRNYQMVFYNKTMFKAAGVAFPADNWTWADFQATAKKLTTGTGAAKVYGAMADLLEYWPMVAYQKLGNFWYLNADKTATRFEDPAMKESAQLWYDLAMVDKSVVPLSEYMTLKYNNDTNGMIGLYSGKYAMCFLPVYGCLYLNASYGAIPAGTDIGMANMPSPTGVSKPVTSFYTSTASIPANVKDKVASWTLLKYITIDRADLFAGPKAMHPGFDFKTPADAAAFDKLIFNNHPGLDTAQCLTLMAKPRDLVSQDITVLAGAAKITDLLKNNATLLFNGELTVDKFLTTLKTDGDAAVKAGK